MGVNPGHLISIIGAVTNVAMPFVCFTWGVVRRGKGRLTHVALGALGLLSSLICVGSILSGSCDPIKAGRWWPVVICLTLALTAEAVRMLGWLAQGSTSPESEDDASAQIHSTTV